ncbi:hypothetical protein AYP87_09055 [Lactobacillus crispatus]|nr:hypothetical protein AYP87_09055 [Lactobacillus crispatus]OXC32654.1 hypothetical protein AYP88_10060 [Lactobacillus crispatus]
MKEFFFLYVFFVQTNHTRKELLFLMFKEINLRNHSSLHKLFYSLMMSGQISVTSNTSIYGEKNKSMMLSAVSFVAEILVSISLFVSDLIIKSAGNIIVMYIVSAFYFAIILFTVPLIRKKEY